MFSLFWCFVLFKCKVAVLHTTSGILTRSMSEYFLSWLAAPLKLNVPPLLYWLNQLIVCVSNRSTYAVWRLVNVKVVSLRFTWLALKVRILNILWHILRSDRATFIILFKWLCRDISVKKITWFTGPVQNSNSEGTALSLKYFLFVFFYYS